MDYLQELIAQEGMLRSVSHDSFFDTRIAAYKRARDKRSMRTGRAMNTLSYCSIPCTRSAIGKGDRKCLLDDLLKMEDLVRRSPISFEKEGPLNTSPEENLISSNEDEIRGMNPEKVDDDEEEPDSNSDIPERSENVRSNDLHNRLASTVSTVQKTCSVCLRQLGKMYFPKPTNEARLVCLACDVAGSVMLLNADKLGSAEELAAIPPSFLNADKPMEVIEEVEYSSEGNDSTSSVLEQEVREGASSILDEMVTAVTDDEEVALLKKNSRIEPDPTLDVNEGVSREDIESKSGSDNSLGDNMDAPKVDPIASSESGAPIVGDETEVASVETEVASVETEVASATTEVAVVDKTDVALTASADVITKSDSEVPSVSSKTSNAEAMLLDFGTTEETETPSSSSKTRTLKESPLFDLTGSDKKEEPSTADTASSTFGSELMDLMAGVNFDAPVMELMPTSTSVEASAEVDQDSEDSELDESDECVVCEAAALAIIPNSKESGEGTIDVKNNKDWEAKSTTGGRRPSETSRHSNDLPRRDSAQAATPEEGATPPATPPPPEEQTPTPPTPTPPPAAPSGGAGGGGRPAAAAASKKGSGALMRRWLMINLIVIAILAVIVMLDVAFGEPFELTDMLMGIVDSVLELFDIF